MKNSPKVTTLVNLQLAKKLKKWGFPQDSMFYFAQNLCYNKNQPQTEWAIITQFMAPEWSLGETIAAPLVQELTPGFNRLWKKNIVKGALLLVRLWLWGNWVRHIKRRKKCNTPYFM